MFYQGFQFGCYLMFWLDDIEVIQEMLGDVQYVVFCLFMNNVFVYWKEIGEIWEIWGELDNMIKVEVLKFFIGRYINECDIEEACKVVVVG